MTINIRFATHSDSSPSHSHCRNPQNPQPINSPNRLPTDEISENRWVKRRRQTRSSRAPERVAMPRLWPPTRRLATKLRTACMVADSDRTISRGTKREDGFVGEEGQLRCRRSMSVIEPRGVTVLGLIFQDRSVSWACWWESSTNVPSAAQRWISRVSMNLPWRSQNRSNTVAWKIPGRAT